MKSNSGGVFLSISVLLVGCACVALVECKSYNDYKLVVVSTSDVDNFKKLDEKWVSKTDFLDDTFEANVDARIVIHKDQQEEFTKFLGENGFEHRVLIENLETVIEEERQQNAEKRQMHKRKSRVSAKDFEMDYFWNYDEIMEYVDQVAADYSDVMTVHALKETLQNRRMVNVEITAPGNKDARPIILIDATIHAREWVAPMVAVNLIRELTENYAEHEEMLELVRFFIVPLVNPDGYQYTHDTNRLWRKNLRGFSEDAVCFGVDCNRNYDHKWSEGETEDVCSIIYAGTEAFSEVETQNIRDIIEEYAPRIILYISAHTYGSLMMYPFSSSTSSLPENHEEQDQVGRLFARTVKERYGTEYKVGNGANLLSIAVGTSKDWAYPKVRLSYTLEMPRGDSTSGFEISFERIGDISKETIDGFIELGNFVADNYDFADWQ